MSPDTCKGSSRLLTDAYRESARSAASISPNPARPALSVASNLERFPELVEKLRGVARRDLYWGWKRGSRTFPTRSGNT